MPICLYIVNKRKTVKLKETYGKEYYKFTLKWILISLIICVCSLEYVAYARLISQWNREYIVNNFGVYTYQISDVLKSISPSMASMLGSDKARKEINDIGGYYAYGKELVNGTSVYDYDVTKLSVHTLGLGLAGIEVYDLLRDEYDIQIEFGDVSNILAYISIGDRLQDIERLVGALADIARIYKKDKTGMLSGEFISPLVAKSPQEAFYADKESLPIKQTKGRISGEFVMCYPPGIPILAPGEMITEEIIEYILYVKEKGCSMQGTEDPMVDNLMVLMQQ